MGIPVAADESIRKSSDPLAVAREKAADLLVIKAQPLGGITHALQIITAAGLPVVVSSALDTAVGLSQGAALAAAIPTLDYDCGLGTASLFLDDVADLRPVDGSIPAGRVTPDADALTRLAASTDRREWWLDRLARCYESRPLIARRISCTAAGLRSRLQGDTTAAGRDHLVRHVPVTQGRRRVDVTPRAAAARACRAPRCRSDAACRSPARPSLRERSCPPR